MRRIAIFILFICNVLGHSKCLGNEWYPQGPFFSPSYTYTFSMGLNNNDEAIALWYDPAVVKLNYATCELGAPWSANQTLVSSGLAPNPHKTVTNGIAINDNSQIYAMWFPQDGKLQGATRNGLNGSWSLTSTFTNSRFYSTYPIQVGMTNDGKIIAVWLNDKSLTQLYYATGTFSSPPSLATSALVTNLEEIQNQTLAFNNQGKAIVAYIDTNANVDTLYVQTFTYGDSSWSGKINLGNCVYDNSYSKKEISLALNDNGQAVIVWIDKSSSKIKARTSSDSGATWTAATTISTTTGTSPHVTLTDSGKAVAVWATPTGGSSKSLITLSTNTWELNEVELITTPISEIRLANDNSDQAIVIWKNSSDSQVYSATWSFASSSWFYRITPIGSFTAQNPLFAFDDFFLAINSNTQGIGAWSSPSGGYQLMSGAFFLPLPTPPTPWSPLNPSQQPPGAGYQFKNKSLSQTEYINHFSWLASSTRGIIGYNIYRNGEYIASVSLYQLSYDDRGQKKKRPVVYGIASYNLAGESSKIYIVVP